MAASGNQAVGQGGLTGFAQSLIDQGNAKGWQSFGQASQWNGNEAGQDIGLPLGTPVPGVNGTVTAVTPLAGSAGDSMVTIQDDAGNILRVLHIIPNVSAGQRITSSTIIGVSNGAPSSISSGPHIELQVQPAGSAGNVDPVAWLKSQLGVATTPDLTATQKFQQAGTPNATAQAQTAPASTTLDFGQSVGHYLLQFGLMAVALVLIVLGVVILLRHPIEEGVKVAAI